MKTFLLKVVAFGALVILLCLGLELFFLTVPNEYSYKREYIEKNGDKIATLILGHSHAANGIDPKLLGDSVFNMAISARNTYYDAAIAERYVPQMKNLRRVIWPLGYNFQYLSYIYPCTSRKKEETSYTATYKCMYEKYMGISYEADIPYKHWSEILNSKLNYGAIFLNGDFKEKIGCDSLGYQKLGERPTNWKEHKLPVAPDFANPNAALAMQEGLSYMKRIARVCKDNNVRLIVITMPCYKTFLDKTTERGINDMYLCVESMRSVYPDMEYYNFIADTCFVDEDFFNSSHLNDVGAKKFTKILREITGQRQKSASLVYPNTADTRYIK